MLSGDPTHALLLGRMAQAGETPLAVLPITPGALAVSAEQLWLTQPQLLGGPSVAAVALATVGAVAVREARGFLGAGRGLRVEVVVDGHPLRFTTRAGRAAAEEFARAVTTARRGHPD